MSRSRDLAILRQVRQEDARNAVQEDGRSDPYVTYGGWTITTESVVEEDLLISGTSDINISKEHKPSRNPLL